ncbi:MAG: hypothetical protein JSV50_15600 [Desulfobacteraceae bacterium]|nr:MAG: hypothetical protein JSV50_15600 [Desulfobacteraceae bacterium]
MGAVREMGGKVKSLGFKSELWVPNLINIGILISQSKLVLFSISYPPLSPLRLLKTSSSCQLSELIVLLANVPNKKTAKIQELSFLAHIMLFCLTKLVTLKNLKKS